jgi:hypothetical protein
MFWTGSFMMLMEGIIFLAIITVIGAIKYSKNKANFYLNLFKRTITVGVIGLFLLLLPTEKLVNLKHHNNPKYAKILLKTLQYPDNIEYQKALQQEHEKMDPTLNRDSE